MSNFDYFCHLSLAVLEFMAYFAPMTFLLALAVIGSLFATLIRERIPRLAVTFGALLPATVTFAILLVGVAFVRPEFTSWKDGVSAPVPWFQGFSLGSADGFIDILAWSQVLLSGVLIWWAKRGWPLVLAASLWWGWVSLIAAGVASMSVTGLWL
jgi:hypothetical protein